MLAAERHKKICDLLEEQEAVRVTELSQLFSVTEETIRRDLEKLERENKVIRQHGGAIKIQTNDNEVLFSKRKIVNVREKKMIAEYAANLVHEGDKIFLDASSTAWYLANNLPNIPLVVITNSLHVVTELADKDKIQVICTGGRYNARSHSFLGPLAERSIMNYHVDKSFISCKGAHILNGVSDSNELQAIIKSLMITNSTTSYLMLDSSKVNKNSFANIGGIEKFNTIITDEEVDAKFRIQTQELGISIVIA